jgi:hypothetical protein
MTFITFHFIYGMSSFPLMNSIIFQRGRSTTNQVLMPQFPAKVEEKIRRTAIFLGAQNAK